VLYNAQPSGNSYLGIGNGAGGFNFVSLFWSTGYDTIYAQDLNGDGRTDVILYNSISGAAYVGISPGGNGTSRFAYTYSYWGTGKKVAISPFPMNPPVQIANDNGGFIDDAYLALLGHTVDPGSWNTAVTRLNAGSNRDAAINAILNGAEYQNDRNTFQNNNGYGCGWPADANGQFLIMLYHYALNRCPNPSEYQYWENILTLPTNKSSVVIQIIYGAEFQGGHAASVNTFLASQSQSAPAASAVWFGASPGGSDSVAVLYQGLYRTDFYDFAGSGEITQATVIVGPSNSYNGSCSVQYSPSTQQLSLLNNSGAVIGSGLIGQPGSGSHVVLSGTQCQLDVTASSATAVGSTLNVFVSLAFTTAGTYGWYGRAQALAPPNTVTGPVSASLGTVSVTGSTASAIPQTIPGVPSPSYYLLNNWYSSIRGSTQTWSYCLGNGSSCWGNGILSAQNISNCQVSDPNVSGTITYPSKAAGHADVGGM